MTKHINHRRIVEAGMPADYNCTHVYACALCGHEWRVHDFDGGDIREGDPCNCDDDTDFDGGDIRVDNRISIRPTIPAPVNPGFEEQSPFLSTIWVEFDHVNCDIDEIASLDEALRAMFIEEEVDFSNYRTGGEIARAVKNGEITADSFTSLFLDFANSLVELGELAADGSVEITQEYADLLARFGVRSE